MLSLVTYTAADEHCSKGTDVASIKAPRMESRMQRRVAAVLACKLTR